jgi:acyl-CoA thioesterase
MQEKQGKNEQNPDLEYVMQCRNRDNYFARMLGITVVEMQTGFARARMRVTEQMRNPIGSVHGGCLFTVADVTCGAAASSYGMMVTTLDSSFHFLRAGLSGCTELIGEARAIKHGKRITVLAVTVADQDGEALCSGTFTYMSLQKPLPY